MQQEPNQDFHGVTLAILFGGKVAVACAGGSPDAPRWSLPETDRTGRESPAECALRLLKSTLGLDLPVTRLNWPIIGTDENAQRRWFFAAWITPAEWDVVTRGGGPGGTVMLGLPAFLAADSVPDIQKTRLRSYLDQPRPVVGRA